MSLRHRSFAVALSSLTALSACGEVISAPTPVVREMRLVVHYDTHVGSYDSGYPRTPMSSTTFFVLQIDPGTSRPRLSGSDMYCAVDQARIDTTGGTITLNLDAKNFDGGYLTLTGSKLADGSFRGTAHCQERAGPHSDHDYGTFVLEPKELPERSLVFVTPSFQVRVHDTVRIAPAVVTRGGDPAPGPLEFSFDRDVLTDLGSGRFLALKPGSTVVRVMAAGEEKASTTITITFPPFNVFPDTVVMLPGQGVQLNLQSYVSGEGLKKYAVSKWSSSDPSVATVDAAGMVNAVAAGKATISAERDGFVLAGTVIVQPPAATRFTAIAQSFDRTCALDDTGRPWCWGKVEPTTGPVSRCESVFGGIGPNSGRLVYHCARFPVRVSDMRFKSLTDGSGITGIAEDGSLYRFDAGGPLPLASGFQFTSAAIWNSLNCGVLTSASGVCWGYTSNGTGGDGSARETGPWPQTPQPIAGDRKWSSLTLNCGLTTEGEAYCWGPNDRGRLGVGLDSTVRSGCSQACILVPTKVLSTSTYSSIAAGDFDFCAITTAGATHCWGPIARSSSIPIASGGRPVEVPGISLSRVFRAGRRVCGFDGDRRVQCLVKDGNAASYAAMFSFAPLAIPFRVRALATSEYDYAPCAISDEDGAVYCWGNGDSGRLGNGTSAGTVPIAAPVKVAGQP